MPAYCSSSDFRLGILRDTGTILVIDMVDHSTLLRNVETLVKHLHRWRGSLVGVSATLSNLLNWKFKPPCAARRVLQVRIIMSDKTISYETAEQATIDQFLKLVRQSNPYFVPLIKPMLNHAKPLFKEFYNLGRPMLKHLSTLFSMRLLVLVVAYFAKVYRCWLWLQLHSGIMNTAPKSSLNRSSVLRICCVSLLVNWS